MFRVVRLLALVVVVGLVATLLAALVLVLTQAPAPLPERESASFNFAAIPRTQNAPPLTPYTTRQGDTLSVRHYPAQSPDAPLVVLIHGSGWHGLQHHRLASYLANTGANVLVPDLRGHGFDPERRGDVDYIGQFEDDLADLITLHRQDGQQVYMLGHSSGGGLVVRMAGGQHGHLLDGAILLAPYLGYDAPTTRENSGDWAQALTRRIIGLTLLNQFGLTAFNDRTVLQFHFPPEVLEGPLGPTATPAYSYRLMVSYAPRPDLHAELAALPPWLLLVGSEDEAFVADAYEPLMREHAPDGDVLVVPGLGHLELVEAPEVWQVVGEWVNNSLAGGE